MGIDAVRIKALLTHEMGLGFEDALDAANAEVRRWEGSKRGLKSGVDAVMLLLGHIKRDVDEEICTSEQAEYAQNYTQRAADALRNLVIQADAMRLRAEGKADAFKVVVGTTKKMHDKAADKLSVLTEHAIQTKNDEAPNGPRTIGTHPGPSIRHLRDDEAEKGNGTGTKKAATKKPAHKRAKKKAKK